MPFRMPAVAGRFYPADAARCRAAVTEMMRDAAADCPAADAVGPAAKTTALGGIVPHAGWICSGAVAARVLAELRARIDPDVVVVFGAVHVAARPVAAVDPAGVWSTPMGEVPIDEALALRVLAMAGQFLIGDAEAHRFEHSIEVELPFVMAAWPQARLLPIMTPPTPAAVDVGRITADACAALGRRAVFLGSTDLTHYGPSYDFTPRGVGEAGICWARDVNDRRMIDLIIDGRAADAVGEARSHRNACGAGAIAATLAAVEWFGAGERRLLRHTTSYDVLRRPPYSDRSDDSVGYAGLICLNK